MVEIGLIRGLEHYTIQRTRKNHAPTALRALQVVKGYEKEEREPSEIFDNIVVEPTKSHLKDIFLNLVKEKAAVLMKLTKVIDEIPFHECMHKDMQDIWCRITASIKKFKHLFIDLQDKSIGNIQAYSEKLISAINALRIHHGLSYRQFDREMDDLPEVVEVLKQENFVREPRSKDPKGLSLGLGLNELNMGGTKHLKLGKREPVDWVKDIVEASAIEAKLHPYIDQLIAP